MWWVDVFRRGSSTKYLSGNTISEHCVWCVLQAVEKFSANTSTIGDTLRHFVKRIQETEFPNTVEDTQKLTSEHQKAHSEVHEVKTIKRAFLRTVWGQWGH